MMLLVKLTRITASAVSTISRFRDTRGEVDAQRRFTVRAYLGGAGQRQRSWVFRAPAKLPEEEGQP